MLAPEQPTWQDDTARGRTRMRQTNQPELEHLRSADTSAHAGATRAESAGGWPGRPSRSWHAWCTGTPAPLAAARMQTTAAYTAHCQKSAVVHEATSSGTSGSVPAS